MVDVNKFREEEAMGYNIQIIGRNIEVTEPLRLYIWNKLSKIERFHEQIMDVHVNLDIQKLEHSCVIIVKFGHMKIKASASSTDMYASIDKAIDRLAKMLARWKERIQEHHKKKLSIVDVQVNVLRRPYNELDEINAQIEEENKKKQQQLFQHPQIIGKETRPLKMLTTEEAVMRLELSGDQFLVYRAEEDQRLKVLYLRSDGHYGLIQPE